MVDMISKYVLEIERRYDECMKGNNVNTISQYLAVDYTLPFCVPHVVMWLTYRKK